MSKYDHRKIEKKWQKEWEKSKLYKTQDTKNEADNFYLLTEFPYPSGNLHVGHWYAFSVPDILARYMRMKGKNVLYPIGFDAFGLPAENAAIKNKLNPRIWTQKNIEYMRKQIHSMGASFDWSREVITCDPAYYKWTQWLFLQLYKKGLVYQKETAVNWCPNCKTVLANEQIVDGKCERCDSEVIQKQMLQWNIKITDYADRLIDDLEQLDWPEEIKESQRNWIGRSQGAEIDFPLEFEKSGSPKPNYLLIHGYDSSSRGAFLPWLKEELEKKGFEVQAPDLPNSSHPKEKEQVARVLNDCRIDEHTIVVGHSLGGTVALKALQKANKKIAGLVLVAPAIDKEFPGAERRAYWADFSWDIDYEKIMRLTNFRIILSDYRERQKRGAYIRSLADKLGAQVVAASAQKEHFVGKEEPIILSQLLPHITVFTTRPDTLFGATYMVLAPEHPWVQLSIDARHDVLSNKKEVIAYVEKAKRKTELERQTGEKEKTGVRLDGVSAINPATGGKIPVFIADYVLGHYGTGAIMAVPAHDERDFEFARKYHLPIKTVIIPDSTMLQEERAYIGEGNLVDSGKYSGMNSIETRRKITDELGRRKTTYKMRDWVVSRQRYWGVPIPIIHCEKCGNVAVPAKDLPVILPEIKDYLPEGSGKSPLAKAKKWVQVKCPQCGGRGERETDTLDTFVDSSWYFLRYTDPKNKKEFASRKKQDNWMPVNFYSGGPEHTTMHVLYSRFWHKALFDLGLVKDSEPYKRRMSHGLILGPDSQKMSKSHGNVIDPDELVERLGADTVRLYLAFIGPYNEVGHYPWNPNGVVGIRRFLERALKVSESVVSYKIKELDNKLHKTIKKVGQDIEALKFNTAVSALMIFLNDADKIGKINKVQWSIFLRLLAPFAPHISEELWRQKVSKTSIHRAQWPAYDLEMMKDELLTIVIQVNGKVRSNMKVVADAGKETIEKLAREAIADRIEGKKISRTIVVQNRLVNFVLE